METPVKQRLIGALVLALVAILFLPMLLKPDVKAPDVSEVPLDMPRAPESEFETHDLPLNVPSGKTPVGGVLGVPKAPASTSTEAPIIDQVPAAVIKAPDNIASLPTSRALPTIEPVTTKPLDMPKPIESKPIESKPIVAPSLKPVVTEKPVEIKPAAVAAGNFTIAIGSFTKLDSANALVARLKAEKLPVLTEKISVDGRPAVKIRIGPYVDRASAEVARLKADEIAGGVSKVNVQDAVPNSTNENKPVVTAKAQVAAKPAAIKPVAAAAVASGFSVQLLALSDNTKAEEMRNRARSMGFNAFVKRVETEKGVLYSVRLGPVADRDAANKLRDEATQKLGKTGIVKTHP
jgi:DedD protein